MKVEFSKKTIKSLQRTLKIYAKSGNIEAVKKISAIIMLASGISIEKVADIWCVSTRTVYNWQNEFLVRRMGAFCGIKRRKGNAARLSDAQKEELKKIIVDGPEAAGFSRGSWTAVMISEVIEKKFKVYYNHRYICDLLKKMGMSYIKAKWVSDQADWEKKTLWKNETWPELLTRAKHEGAALLFEDEVSFALWGSLGYTWAIRGQQPLVKTSGKRRKLKVFGAIDYFSGRFVFQSEEGKLNSHSYITFLKKILSRFPGKVILIHDGAPYHTSEDTQNFLAANPRIEVVRLPSYSPEYNIIEYLWKNVKSHTHNKYFSDFSSLTKFVHYRLRYFQTHASEVLNLCDSYQDMLQHDDCKVA